MTTTRARPLHSARALAWLALALAPSTALAQSPADDDLDNLPTPHVRPPDGHEPDGRQPDGQPSGGRGADGQPSGGRGADGQPSGGRGADGQPSGGQGADGQASGGRGADGQPSGGRGADGQPSGGQGADGQASGGQASGGQTTAGGGVGGDALSISRPGTLQALFDSSGLELRGYVQAQGQLDQQSQDQLMQGGGQLNQDGFVVRRARIALSRTWTYAALAFELDANTVAGATVGLRRAEAALRWPAESKEAPPIAAIAVGLTDIPFGRELIEPSQQRLFMERTTASLAFFPGEPDIGARAWGGHRAFRYALALLAGEPINERNGFNRPDPNAAKDLVGRVGIEVAPVPRLAIAGGVSIVAGRGFHPGRDATKDSLEWRDINENGAVELGELFSVPGTAAVPSENFRRWALGADLAVTWRSRLGLTRFAAEVIVASNLDRGLFVADPVVAGQDIRHLGAYASVLQDLGAHGFAGVRFDYYDPNLDAFDERGGMLLPLDETVTTLSPLIGARLPGHVRASIQYDLVLDNLARDTRGVPADLANNRVTARLQVDL